MGSGASRSMSDGAMLDSNGDSSKTGDSWSADDWSVTAESVTAESSVACQPAIVMMASAGEASATADSVRLALGGCAVAGESIFVTRDRDVPDVEQPPTASNTHSPIVMQHRRMVGRSKSGQEETGRATLIHCDGDDARWHLTKGDATDGRRNRRATQQTGDGTDVATGGVLFQTLASSAAGRANRRRHMIGLYITCRAIDRIGSAAKSAASECEVQPTEPVRQAT